MSISTSIVREIPFVGAIASRRVTRRSNRSSGLSEPLELVPRSSVYPVMGIQLLKGLVPGSYLAWETYNSNPSDSSSTDKDVSIRGGGNELSTSIVDASSLGGDVTGTSTETSRWERARGMTCEEREDRAVFVWYGIERNEIGYGKW